MFFIPSLLYLTRATHFKAHAHIAHTYTSTYTPRFYTIMEILELVNQDHLPTEERPFACTVSSCNKTFGMTISSQQKAVTMLISYFITIGRRSDLVRHLRIHTNERYVKIYSLASWSKGLYTMMYRPFKCREPDCGKSFIQVRMKNGTFEHWCAQQKQWSWYSYILCYLFI